MAKSYKNLESLIAATQKETPLVTLYQKAPAVQLAFVRQCAFTALELCFNDRAQVEKAMSLIEATAQRAPKDEKPDKALAIAFNDFAREYSMDLRIIANGYKGLHRITDKQKMRHEQNNEVSDLIRVTVCSIRSPDVVMRFRDALKKSYDHFDDGVHVNAAGTITSDFRVAFDGIVSQVEVGEKDLMVRAGAVTHLLYEIRRDIDNLSAGRVPQAERDGVRRSISHRVQAWKTMTDDMLHTDFDVRLSKAGDVSDYLQHIAPQLTVDERKHMADCLFDMDRLSYIGNFLRHAKHEKLMPEIQPVTEQADDKTLKGTGLSLLQLGQLVHVAYIGNAEKPWRDLYCKEAGIMNAKSGKPMPKRLLDIVGESHGNSGRGR